MSSILRALKKLEKDSRHLEGNRSLETQFVSLADTGSPRPAGAVFIMAGAGIICGLVVLAGWYFFSERFRPEPAATVTLSSPAVKPLRDVPAQSAELKDSREITAAASAGKASPVKPGKPVSSAEKSQNLEPAADPPAVTSQAETLKDARPAESSTPEETVTAKNALPLPATEQVPEPADSAAAPPAKHILTEAGTVPGMNLAELSDPGMKLQAITWSKVPQKRIAVINNRIVREGESVSGYHVRTINQDDVILSRDGENWQLLFRIR